MTSRELLALAADRRCPRSPRARRCSRRAGSCPALARLAASPTGRARADALAPSRSRAPSEPLVGDWLVVDAAGGLLVGVIGARRARRACSSHRRTSARAALARLARAGGSGSTTPLLYLFWAILLAVPLAGNLGAAWLLVEATTAASALLVGFSGKPRALEAGWKYLDPHLARARRRAARDRDARGRDPGGGLGELSWQALLDLRRRQRDRARRLPAPARRPRREDRLGAGAQLAPRRALGGAAAGLGAALRRAAARRAARRLALASRRSRRSSASRRPQSRPDRLRARLARRRGARSSGARWPGSACSPTRASSTWA